jgi:hypothetical protein
MENSPRKLIQTILCENTKTKLSKKEQKIYIFFLHEDFYSLVIERNQIIPAKPYHKKKPSAINFLVSKRAIKFFRSNEYFQKRRFSTIHKKKNFLKSKKKMFYELMLESITFILFLNKQKKTSIEKYFLEKKYISTSVHKPLQSIENHWQYNSFTYSGKISSLLHPEIFLRIIRKNFHDISLLHFLRNILHFEQDEKTETVTVRFQKNLLIILWNFSSLEVDYFFFKQWKDYFILDKDPSISMNQSLSCLQKIKKWKYFFGDKRQNKFKNLNFKYFLNREKNLSFLVDSITYNYVRTNSSWLLNFQNKKIWNHFIRERFIRFLNRRFGYVYQTNRIIPISSKNSFFFLGHILQFQKKTNSSKIHLKNFFIQKNFVTYYICFLNPMYLMIKLFSKNKFCDRFGYPLKKSGWSTFTDIEIIQQFFQIQHNLFLFYSGCTNRKALSRLEYILVYSCAKTLACKHKTNLKKIWKIYGNNFRLASFLSSNQKSKKSKLEKYVKDRLTRIWHLKLTEVNFFILDLENLNRNIKL